MIQWIPDFFEDAAVKTATTLDRDVYFDYGYYEVVTQNLQEKTESITMKGMKYPLIWLKMDFVEMVAASRIVPHKVKCNLVFATETETAYTMKQRRDITFMPTLMPIMEQYLIDLGAMAGGYDIRYNPYWGIRSGAGNGGKNAFNDFVDAIEVIGLEVTVKRKIC